MFVWMEGNSILMKPLVLYHDNLVLYHDTCPDGFTAAWAVWTVLGDEAEYRAVNYGQPIPTDTTGRRVILVDFSYPRTLMDALADRSAQVEVYDHHKTAEAELAGWTGGKVVFDMERSGAGIAWDEFHQGEAVWLGLRPNLVSYVEDRDLWRWTLPDSREVSEYLFSLPRTFEQWDQVNVLMGQNASPRSPRFSAIVEAGQALLRAKKLRIVEICKNARWIFLGGQRIPVVNTAWDFSEIGEYLCEQFPEAPFAGYYFDRKDARQFGFRSHNGFDVSAVCKRYGGGGHAAAAGFTSAIGWLPDPA